MRIFKLEPLQNTHIHEIFPWMGYIFCKCCFSCCRSNRKERKRELKNLLVEERYEASKTMVRPPQFSNGNFRTTFSALTESNLLARARTTPSSTTRMRTSAEAPCPLPSTTWIKRRTL